MINMRNIINNILLFLAKPFNRKSLIRDISFDYLKDVDKITFFSTNLTKIDFASLSLEQAIEISKNIPRRNIIVDISIIERVVQFLKEREHNWESRYYYIAPVSASINLEFHLKERSIGFLGIYNTGLSIYEENKNNSFYTFWRRDITQDELTYLLSIFGVMPTS